MSMRLMAAGILAIAAAAAVAQNNRGDASPIDVASLERRVERIERSIERLERAVERLEANRSERRGMMGDGGMMGGGGMMGRGMMGGGAMGGSSPNERWRSPEKER